MALGQRPGTAVNEELVLTKHSLCAKCKLGLVRKDVMTVIRAAICSGMSAQGQEFPPSGKQGPGAQEVLS